MVTEPKEGAYAIKLVKGGIRLPTRLRFDPDPSGEPEKGRWRATIDGTDEPGAYTHEQVKAVMMAWVMGEEMSSELRRFVRVLLGDPITESDYNRMMARRTWAKEHAPDDPCLDPYRPIDLARAPSLW